MVHVFCQPCGTLTSQWQLVQGIKQHMHAFFCDDGDQGSQDVYGLGDECHDVTEALEAYQPRHLLHGSKGHFLHCPPRLGKSATALPAEREILTAMLSCSTACHVACLAPVSKEATRDQIT